VVEGELHIEFEAAAERVLRPWQAITVPAGTVHRTRAVGRTVNLTFEQQGAETVFVEPPAGL
jgi:mannose-6-phosphate isomerase-like protein (cupin superfamily)